MTSSGIKLSGDKQPGKWVRFQSLAVKRFDEGTSWQSASHKLSGLSSEWLVASSCSAAVRLRGALVSSCIQDAEEEVLITIFYICQ